MTLDKNIIGREIIAAIETSKSDYRTLAPVELWVNAVTGNDANDGSEDAPLATLIEAERRLPPIIDHDVLIHVGPHTGSGYAPPRFRHRLMQNAAQIDVIADSGGTQNDGFNELYTGVAQVGSLHTKVVAPAGLGVDTYRGKTIEMTSGSQINFRRTISYNTDTDIVPCLCWQSGLIAVGNTFRILEPAVVIDLRGGPWEVTQGVSPVVQHAFDGDRREISGVNFINFLFECDSTSYVYIGDHARFHGCEATNSLVFSGGSISVGISHVRVDASEPTSNGWERVGSGPRCANVDLSAWVGWGLFLRAGLLGPQKGLEHWFYAVVAPRVYVFGGRTRIRGCNIYTSGATVGGGGGNGAAYLELNGKVYLPDVAMRVTNETGAALTVSGQLALAECDEALLTGQTIGVSCTAGAKAKLLAGVTIVSATGVKAVQGSRVHIRSNAVSFTVTGNQLEVGNTPTVSTWAALNTVGAYIAEADGSVIQRVT